jgi:hypothetical protein
MSPTWPHHAKVSVKVLKFLDDFPMSESGRDLLPTLFGPLRPHLQAFALHFENLFLGLWR